MSGESAGTAALIAATALAQVASQPVGPLSDIQMLSVAVGSGLVGGFVATLMADEEISRRGLAKRMLASGMIAPALTLLALMWLGAHPTWLVVAAVSGPAGLFAWPIWELAPGLVRKYLPKAVEKRLGGDGDP